MITFLNGFLLPLMAVWIIPSSLEKNNFLSPRVGIKLFIVFAVTLIVHFEAKGIEAFILGLFNCCLVYLGALICFYFQTKAKKS